MSILVKNLKAIKSPVLKDALRSIQNKNYKIIQEKDCLNIKTGGGICIYHNAKAELDEMLAKYEQYKFYEVLYFYGFGSGLLYKELAKNENLKHIVVFERDIELLLCVLSKLDFSKELQDDKIVIFHPSQSDEIANICKIDKFCYNSKLYFLDIHSKFYENFEEEILRLNNFLISQFSYYIKSIGNDPLDALQGILQFMQNLSVMCENISCGELYKKRYKKHDTAVIVSTGPSLSKQLELLKLYQDRVSIFCADSAYPILMKNGIVPDYVFMIERSDFTAEFFNHSFKGDENTIFMVASLAHPKAFEYLKRENKQILALTRANPFALYLNLKNFGWIVEESNVAVFAFTTAVYRLGFKTVLFIGQDLAFDESGHSHPKDYQHGEDFEQGFYKEKDYEQILGYGGNKTVKSHKIWIMFKQNLENFIRQAPATVINCTEGGARILYCKEAPFKDCLLEFAKQKKSYIKLEKTTLQKSLEFKLQAYAKTKKSIKKCIDFTELLERNFKQIKQEYENIQKIANELELIQKLDVLLEKAQNFKKYLEANSDEFDECLMQTKTQFNINLAKIYALYVSSQQDYINKKLFIIKELLEYFLLLDSLLKALLKVLKEPFENLEKELLSKNLKKYLRL